MTAWVMLAKSSISAASNHTRSPPLVRASAICCGRAIFPGVAKKDIVFGGGHGAISEVGLDLVTFCYLKSMPATYLLRELSCETAKKGRRLLVPATQRYNLEGGLGSKIQFCLFDPAFLIYQWT